MTDLPTRTFLTSTTTTEVQFQSAIGDLYDFVGQLCVSGPYENLTIASGSVTPTHGLITVDTENGDPTDNLDLIVPSSIGEKLIIVRAVSGARPVTIRTGQSGTGSIALRGAANVVMADPSYMIALLWNAGASHWDEMWRNFGLYTTQSGEITAIQTALGLGTAAYVNVGTSTGQVVLKENFGTGAFVNTGTSSGQVPLANQLGSLAFLSIITNAQLDGSGVSPGTYNNVTVNAQGRVTGGSNVSPVNSNALAKAHVTFDNGGSMFEAFNVASVSSLGSGRYTVNYAGALGRVGCVNCTASLAINGSNGSFTAITNNAGSSSSFTMVSAGAVYAPAIACVSVL